MKTDTTLIKAYLKHGFGVEDIAHMSMMTLRQIRAEVSRMRENGTLAELFDQNVLDAPDKRA